MTITSTTSKNQFTATGSQDTFNYTFKIFDEDDIKVITTDLSGVETVEVITTDYTVTGVGNAGGGTIVYVTDPTQDFKVTLKRNEPLTQEIDYVEGDDFPAAAHEEGLDRSAIRDQFLEEEISRTITLPESTSSTLSFSEPAGNGDLFLALNTAADTVVYTAGIAGPQGPQGDPGEIQGPVSSVDDEIALFSGTTGALVKSATGTGFVKVTSGVMGTPVATIDTAEIAVSAVETATINDNAVTLAKMAHGTDGNLITYDAAGAPAFVATGTATHALTSNGAGTAPTFQALPAGGAFTTIEVATPSGATSVEFTTDIDSYDALFLVFSGLRSSSNLAELQMGYSINAGTSYANPDESSRTTVIGTTETHSSTAPSTIAVDVGNATGENVSGYGYINNMSGTLDKMAEFKCFSKDSNVITRTEAAHVFETTSNVNAIEVSFSGGTMTGTIVLIGVNNT